MEIKFKFFSKTFTTALLFLILISIASAQPTLYKGLEEDLTVSKYIGIWEGKLYYFLTEPLTDAKVQIYISEINIADQAKVITKLQGQPEVLGSPCQTRLLKDGLVALLTIRSQNFLNIIDLKTKTFKLVKQFDNLSMLYLFEAPDGGILSIRGKDLIKIDPHSGNHITQRITGGDIVNLIVIRMENDNKKFGIIISFYGGSSVYQIVDTSLQVISSGSIKGHGKILAAAFNNDDKSIIYGIYKYNNMVNFQQIDFEINQVTNITRFYGRESINVQMDIFPLSEKGGFISFQRYEESHVTIRNKKLNYQQAICFILHQETQSYENCQDMVNQINKTSIDQRYGYQIDKSTANTFVLSYATYAKQNRIFVKNFTFDINYTEQQDKYFLSLLLIKKQDLGFTLEKPGAVAKWSCKSNSYKQDKLNAWLQKASSQTELELDLKLMEYNKDYTFIANFNGVNYTYTLKNFKTNENTYVSDFKLHSYLSGNDDFCSKTILVSVNLETYSYGKNIPYSFDYEITPDSPEIKKYFIKNVNSPNLIIPQIFLKPNSIYNLKVITTYGRITEIPIKTEQLKDLQNQNQLIKLSPTSQKNFSLNIYNCKNLSIANTKYIQQLGQKVDITQWYHNGLDFGIPKCFFQAIAHYKFVIIFILDQYDVPISLNQSLEFMIESEDFLVNALQEESETGDLNVTAIANYTEDCPGKTNKQHFKFNWSCKFEANTNFTDCPFNLKNYSKQVDNVQTLIIPNSIRSQYPAFKFQISVSRGNLMRQSKELIISYSHFSSFGFLMLIMNIIICTSLFFAIRKEKFNKCVLTQLQNNPQPTQKDILITSFVMQHPFLSIIYLKNSIITTKTDRVILYFIRLNLILVLSTIFGQNFKWIIMNPICLMLPYCTFIPLIILLSALIKTIKPIMLENLSDEEVIKIRQEQDRKKFVKIGGQLLILALWIFSLYFVISVSFSMSNEQKQNLAFAFIQAMFQDFILTPMIIGYAYKRKLSQNLNQMRVQNEDNQDIEYQFVQRPGIDNSLSESNINEEQLNKDEIGADIPDEVKQQAKKMIED